MLIHTSQRSRKSQYVTWAPLHSSLCSPAWNEFLVSSKAFNTLKAYDIVCRLSVMTRLTEFHNNKKQNIATGLLLDKLRKQDFAGPSPSSVLKSPGTDQSSSCCCLPGSHKRCLACSSPLGNSLTSFASSAMGSVLLKDFTLKIMITLAVLDAQMNLTPSLIIRCVTGCTTSFSLSGDMLWYCQKIFNIRFMTAITLAYSHAYQATCLAQHLLSVPHHNFQLPKPKSRCPYLRNARSITGERGNDYREWAIHTDGGTRVVEG